MTNLIRKPIVSTAFLLALAVGGAQVDHAAAAAYPANKGNMPHAFDVSRTAGKSANLSKDDVRWGQAELRYRGLYKGSLDGVVGPQTRRALAQFQKDKGLSQTATLDPQTMQALTGGSGIDQGSSSSPSTKGDASMTTSAGR
jgi:peptidoglycan hydrolase-like protein with peptidoglycan-binding domain